MPASFVDDLRCSLGLTGGQMADLLWIPRSGLTMAAGGHRPMPAHLLPWLNLLQEIAVVSLAKENPAPGETFSHLDYSFARRQLRLMQTELEKIKLQLERVEAKLEKAERLCAWLPRLLESALCKADEDRKKTAELLLRQSREQRQHCWEQANLLHTKLLAVRSGIAHWQKLI